MRKPTLLPRKASHLQPRHAERIGCRAAEVILIVKKDDWNITMRQTSNVFKHFCLSAPWWNFGKMNQWIILGSSILIFWGEFLGWFNHLGTYQRVRCLCQEEVGTTLASDKMRKLKTGSWGRGGTWWRHGFFGLTCISRNFCFKTLGNSLRAVDVAN